MRSITRSGCRFVASLGVFGALNTAGCPQTEPLPDGGLASGGANGAAGTSSQDAPAATGAPASPSGPMLFVADGDAGVVAFANPAGLDGDVAPVLRIWGTYGYTIWLDSPLEISVDRSGDLVALTQDGLLAFDNAESAAGNLVPNREITGPSTYLQYEGFNTNRGMAIDRANDRLFAATVDSVIVFDDFSRLRSGDVKPSRRITSVDIGQIRNIALGPNGDLYLADVGKDAVLVFADAGARDGSIRADRMIQIPDADAAIPGTLINPDVVYVDQQDHLYVIESLAGWIHVFDQAASRSGTVTPERVIDFDFDPFPSLKDFWPVALVVDSQGVGYVSDYAHTAIRVIPNIASRSGTLTPERTLQGFATQLQNPDALFIWE